jgi:hypothetical protein
MSIAADIDTFKAMIKGHGGLARSNWYAVYMTHPVGKRGLLNGDIEGTLGNAARSLLSGQGSGVGLRSFFQDPRDIYLMCDAVNIPGRQIMTQEYMTGLRTRKKPYSFINSDVNMSFHLTNDYYIYKYIKSWMDGIVVEKGDNHYTVEYKEKYTTDIIIQQLSPNGNSFLPVYSCKLRNAFPISLSDVALDQADNTTLKCAVTFAYDEFEELGLTENLGALLGGATKLIDNTLGL